MSSTLQELVNKFSTLFPSGSQSDFNELIDFSFKEKTDPVVLKTAWNDHKGGFNNLIAALESRKIAANSDVIIKVSDILDKIIELKETSDRATKLKLVTIFSFLCESIDPNIESNRNSKIIDLKESNDEAKAALKHFVKIGKIVGNSPGFEKSTVAELEKSFSDKKSFVCSKEKLAFDDAIFLRSFFAIAAPSLVGKTQLAFAFLKCRPLYFVLSGLFDERTQPIYRNFESISQRLLEFAKLDFESVYEQEGIQTNSTISHADAIKNYPVLSATNLLQNHREKKFYTLGLVLAIDQFATDNEFSCSWMEHHAMAKRLTVEPVSINEFAEKSEMLLKRYCVFLDEFKESSATVFLRNLFRAVGLVCLVSNTNTHIANLLGQNAFTGSRGHGTVCWTIVVCKLDPINMSIFDSNTGIFDWTELTSKMVTKLTNSSSKRSLEAFFDFIFEKELPRLRPGVAVFLAESLKDLGQHDFYKSYSAAQCIDLVLKSISNLIMMRKTLLTSIDGLIGTFALHSSVAFDNAANNSNIFNAKNFLRDHLYHLVNPTNLDHWFFALYIDSKEHNKEYLATFSGAEKGLTRWLELSYFDRNETLTLLACLFGGLRGPVANLMQEDVIKRSKANTTQSYSNPKAKSNDGVNFKVQSSVSLIESSHATYDHQTQKQFNFSLQGVLILPFIENVIYNLMQNNPNVPLQMIVNPKMDSKFGVSEYLNKFKVPFLSPSNIEWSKHYTSMFPLRDADCSIKMGLFERTENSEQVDGAFDIISLANFDETPLKAIMECKDWTNRSLPAKELQSILEKALKFQNSKFAFIFCKSIGGIKKKTLGHKDSRIIDLLSFTKQNKINLFRFTKNFSKSSDTFNLVPFRPDVSLFKDPILTAFVFSSSELNSEGTIQRLKNLMKRMSITMK